MTPESTKSFNTYMGVLLIFLALGCFGLGGYMVFVPATEKAAPPPKIATINKQPCIEGLTALGFQAASIGADIRVTDRNNDAEPLERLKNASLGIAMCHLYLKDFCMGPNCPNPTAMTFTLTETEPTDKKTPSAPDVPKKPVTPAPTPATAS
jgi:hypothetical protein